MLKFIDGLTERQKMKLNFYISRTVLGAICLVVLVFFGLVLFVNLIGELGQTGKGNYHFIQAVSYVLLTLPLLIYQIFPTTVLIGVLLGLGTLASHSELVVMRASGMSLKRIATTVLLASLVLIVVVTFIGEVIAPAMARYANNQKNLEQNKGQLISTVSGVWLREDNAFFHIVSIPSSHQVYGVTRFQFNKAHRLVTASQAVSGKLENNHWVFYNITTSVIGDHHLTQKKQASVIWPLRFNLHQFTVVDPTTLTLDELQQQIKYGRMSGVNTSRYQTTYWRRVLQPLTTLIMVLVALPFIFGPLRTVSIGLRLLVGITVGLVFFILNELLTSFGMVYQLSPLVSALSLPILFFFFALFLFGKSISTSLFLLMVNTLHINLVLFY